MGNVKHVDTREEIKNIICKEIAINKSGLARVKSDIGEKFDKSLSSIDVAFIERKYVKYCAKLWLQETTDFLKVLAKSEGQAGFLTICASLDEIRELSQIPDPLRRIEYYSLLMKHYSLVREEDERWLVGRFKRECLEQILELNDAAKAELVLLERFVSFLSRSRRLQSIVREVKADDFCSGSLSFEEFLGNVEKLDVGVHGEDLLVLLEAARDLRAGGDLFLMDKFKELLRGFIQPVGVQVSTVDGRLVVEVTGKSVVVSEVVQLLETPTVKEVRFVGGEVVHVDASLEGRVWHGRNVVIVTRLILVHGEVTWDVSGMDSDHAYEGPEGTGEDGHGRQGQDGYPGESGGNVLILAREIQNPESFTVVSNGGKGSKGQDGGNGKDGEDGKGISKTDFLEKYPPVAKYLTSNRETNILKNVTNIRKDIHDIKSQWYESLRRGFLYQSDETFVEDVTGQIIRDFGHQEMSFYRGKASFPFSGNIFVSGTTIRGEEITFSFERGRLTTNCQAFLLYKGSLGKAGGHGGEYGLGGEGGFAGEVTARSLEDGQVFGIVIEGKGGEEGGKGKGGSYGHHGRNGWDMGYTDYSVSELFTEKWPQFFGLDGESKVDLRYFSSNSSTRIFCPYKERRGEEFQFAELTASRIEHKKQKKYEERMRTRRDNKRKHHARAVRKKTLSQRSILATYSHHLSSDPLWTLQSDLEETRKRALEVIVDNQQQQQKITSELSIKRHSAYQSQDKPRGNILIDTSASSTHRETVDCEGLIEKLKADPLVLDNWYQVKDPSLSQLYQLLLIFKTQKICDNMTQELQDIENLLHDKYMLATLQEIAEGLPARHQVQSIPEDVTKYLTEAKENDNDISHPILGTLNQYLFEMDHQEQNLDKICQFCEKELTENDEILERCLETFISQVGDSEEAHPHVKKYYEEYVECEEYLEQERHRSNVFSEAFESKIFEPRHENFLALWVRCGEDASARSQLEESLQKNKFLAAIYKRFSRRKAEYDWGKCCKDEHVLREYCSYIRGEGLWSRSCKELLAHVYGVNIRLYVQDRDDRLVLEDDHNPLSTKIIHLLYRDGRFTQLNVDKDFLELEEQRKEKDELYSDIFEAVEKVNQEYEDKIDDSPPEDKQFFDDQKDVEKIVKYFPEEQQLKCRLDKITSQYVGQQRVLHYIRKRFSAEGRLVSPQELYFLINSILSSVNEGRQELNVLCWIVAAYPQKSWTDELTLMHLENYFKRSLSGKPDWRNYLSKIGNKEVLLLLKMKLDQHSAGNRVSVQSVEDSLRLLSNIPNETVSLEGLELSEWPYALKEKYWAHKLSELVGWQQCDLSTASYYLLCVENIFGTASAEKLVGTLDRKKGELSPETLTDILSNFHNEKWNLSGEEINLLEISKIDDWVDKMRVKFAANEGERNIKRLVELIEGNANTCKEILNKLPILRRSVESIDAFEVSGKPVSRFTEYDVRTWVREGQSGTGWPHEELLAVVDRGIELKRGFKLRDTQRLAALALLTNDRSTLAQVSTGEGKSLIVVAASVMKALRGQKVDVVTSSSVLAKRDAQDNGDIYELFGVKASHNCSEDVEERKEAYSGNQVVYGDLANFQRDHLLDKFYGKNTMGDRNFENVIIDEVDSMLLDKGNNVLYLSHDLAGLDKVESVYVFIWQWINRPVTYYEDLAYTFDAKEIREAVLNDLYGLVTREDVGKLGSDLDERQRNSLWERLVEAGILDHQGKLLTGTVDDDQLDRALSPDFNRYRVRVRHLLTECLERERFIHVPSNLRPFIELHLDSWIHSAEIAFFMRAGEDYVVDVDKTSSSPDRNPNITIVDRDTGTDQANSQWDEALHQFLQLKHGCKLSLQGLKAVFISNVSFFKLYSNLYGLTGTLGSQRERELLQEIYGLDFVTVPTAKSKLFHEEKPILCASKQDWICQIRDEAKKLTEKKKRSVLIICQTVNDVEDLYKAFGGRKAKHVSTYSRDYEEFDKGFETVQGNKQLGQGQVIIATNLAGRGTDIKITGELRTRGGLHVCLTYLPSNVRVEQQAFGRAARSGDQGSGQLIITDSGGQGYSNSKLLDLKKGRDSEELHRISNIKAYYETKITAEEKCFISFKERYEQLKKELDDNRFPTEVKRILLQSCLDKWAFWLDQHSKCVTDWTDEEDRRKLHKLLDKFTSQLKHLHSRYSGTSVGDSTSWLPWVRGNPAQMIKLGKYLSQNKGHKNSLENAIKLFDEVIKDELYFSEAAHYYKAFALAKKIDWERKPLGEEDERLLKQFKQELRQAAMLLNQHGKFAINAASIIGNIKKKNNESIIQIDSYEEQQETVANIYHMFSQSIEDVFGHAITPKDFISSDIKEELAQKIYKDLLEKGILEKPRVAEDITKEDIVVISSSYGVSVEKLTGFLSKYKGKEINIIEFKKSLKSDMKLPDRNEFWKLLAEKNVTSEQVKFVVVNNEKLKEIDPSLLDYLVGKVEKQSLEISNEEILLNGALPNGINENYDIFKKDDFIRVVGNDKYKVLKETGVFTLNKKALLQASLIENISFPRYDCITLEDFAKVNISESEAEIILAQLLEQNVIEEKDNSENTSYGLRINFEEIQQVQLPSCAVYENVVKGLLSVCFMYRIELQKIVKHLNENNFPVCLKLRTKPHEDLLLELLEQRVIRPVTLAAEDEDLEDKLKRIYVHKTTKGNLNGILSQSNLIPEECIEELFEFLVTKEWIVRQTFRNAEGIINTGISLVKDLYFVNSPGKRQKPLSFENIILNEQNIDKTVEKHLDNQLQLVKESTIKNIASTLKRLRSPLKALKIPCANLKPLSELCESANKEEVNVFSLSGLDDLLHMEEKKWSRKMLRNIAIVTFMGLSQITVGAVIELFSAGTMTHVGAAFIREGVSDLFFAVGAYRSGYFSWADYRQHKMESLVYTAAAAGLGAFLSRGAKVSRFGHKVAGPHFQLGKKVAETSGKQLLDAVGYKVIGKEVLRRTTLKTMKGIAFGLANVGVDMIVENCLQSLCEGIGSEILSVIGCKVDQHDVNISLKRAYEVLGEEKAKKYIDNVTKRVLTMENFTERFLPVANRIINCVIQGVGEAVKKRSKTSNKLELPLSAISKVVVWTERCAHIAKITMITKDLLNNLDQEIKKGLSNLEHNVEHNQEQEVVQDYESFEKEVIEQWKSLLKEKAGKIIENHIVRPILKKCANSMVKYVGKKAQQAHQANKESEHLEYFQQLKQENKEKLQSVQQNRDDRSEIEKHVTEKYHKDLIKLLGKTRNPELFAAIIRENVPMDMTCVSACTKVIHKVIQRQGIGGVTIIVEGEGGMRQQFSSAPGVDGITINVELKDNHFQVHGSRNSDTESKNNCLFEALSEQINLDMTPEAFREHLSACIERDPDMQYVIKQGWHQFSISKGAIGGKHSYTKEISAYELRQGILDETILFSQDSIADHTSDTGGRKRMHIGELRTEIEKHGWKGKPIKAVEVGDGEALVVLDHRRTLAVGTSESPEVRAHFAVYKEDDDFSSETCEKQYKTRKAGEAVKRRMSGRGNKACSGEGFPSYKVKIRRKLDDPSHKETLQKLEKLNFIIGKPSQKP